tara:strand:- start:2017 stop:2388 length:372 start_codon:yes stop_codon:yes gene_type:complete
MSYHNIKSRDLIFPYKALSPTLKKHITYDESELWKEIDRILDEDQDRKFTFGQQLYFNLLHCADSSYFLTNDTNILLEEYMLHKRFSIPLATSIDDALFERMSLFSAIDEEYNACVENGKIHN